MEKFTDYYKILQVHQEADQSMIDTAYKCLSKLYHPDLNKSPDAGERMTQINLAYSVLGDKFKRKTFHREWQKYNKTQSVSTVMAGTDYKVELAQTVLDDFFRDMVTENWEGAYQKLTDVDVQKVPLKDFSDWKNAVGKLYKLANFKITFEKRYVNCEYSGLVYPEIMQFALELTVMDITTGRVNIEKARKYVAFNKSAWKICLGYSNLKPIIAKFTHMTQVKGKGAAAAAGVRHQYEMLDQAQREMFRTQRYGNPLCLMMVAVKPVYGDKVISYEDYVEKCLAHVGGILCETLRKTDIIGRYHEDSFAVFLTETELKQGRTVLKKVVSKLEKPSRFEYKLYYSVAVCPGRGKVEDILKAAFEKTAPDEVKYELAYFL